MAKVNHDLTSNFVSNFYWSLSKKKTQKLAKKTMDK